ncbi:hypothetical protein PTTG_31007, partial [Puccinia triticina 1-1 BBBD Race 1]
PRTLPKPPTIRTPTRIRRTATTANHGSKHPRAGHIHPGIKGRAEAGKAGPRAIKATAGTAATTTGVATAVRTAKTEETIKGTHEENDAVAGKAEANKTSKTPLVDTIIVWWAGSREQE